MRKDSPPPFPRESETPEWSGQGNSDNDAVRGALQFAFSPDGRLLRNFLVEEVVNSVDIQVSTTSKFVPIFVSNGLVLTDVIACLQTLGNYAGAILW